MTPNKFLISRPAIYGIRNLVNSKLYVGKTHCMYRRCSQYIYAFANESRDHLNPHLLAAMKKSGFDKFEMFVLEFCEPEKLPERELYWMTLFDTTDQNKGYNLRLDSSSGMLAHAETKLKISQNMKRQWASGIRDGHSDKLKAAWANAGPLRIAEQTERFRKNRTKFNYVVIFPNGEREACAYLRLKELGIQGSVVNMWRSNRNSAICKGYQVYRHPIGEDCEY